MFAKALVCRNCDEVFALGNYYSCLKCGGILEVVYNYGLITQDLLQKLFARKTHDLWKYRELLPLANMENKVSLGEGGTPLLKSSKIGDSLNLKNLYFKIESANPTGSFKDRPTSISVSKAVELGVSNVIIASSGNGGAAAAAYAARAGLKCFVCVPESTPRSKVNQALSHGAKVVLVEGSYSNSYDLAKEASREYGWFNLTSTFINPYTVEGDKLLHMKYGNNFQEKCPTG